MAVAYREVNQYLRVSANQLPYQDMLFQQLAGMQYFAKLDNLWGYHQLRLDKESSRVTAIITLWGVYRFLARPFGISTAPGEYQDRMAHKVLEGYYLNGVVVYIDDTKLERRCIILTNVEPGTGQNGQVQCAPQAVEVLICYDFCGVPRSYF